MARSMRSSFVLLGIGAVLGVAIWLFSPWLTGRVEPWDADAPIWPASWLLIAVAGGLVGRVRGVCLPVGYALGQILITAPSIFGQFGVLGWMFIAGYAAVASCVSLALAGGVAAVRAIRRSRREAAGGA